MTDVEQFLADLEDKAKAATPGPWVMDGAYPIYSIGRGGLKDKTIGHAQRQWDGDFIAAANPAAVLRLVGMVRWLAAGCDCDAEPCQYGHSAFTGPIAIMPDAHAGTGAVIGFTMPLGEKLVPSVVGVDIGCGMLAGKIPGWSHEAHRDRLIREAVPMGFDTRDTPVAAVEDFREFYPSINAAILEFGRRLGVDAASLLTDDAVIDKLLREHGGKRAWNSIGTLGGGNHFIEVDICEATQEFWLVIHTGSRNFGKQVCEAWKRCSAPVMFTLNDAYF